MAKALHWPTTVETEINKEGYRTNSKTSDSPTKPTTHYHDWYVDMQSTQKITYGTTASRNRAVAATMRCTGCDQWKWCDANGVLYEGVIPVGNPKEKETE